MSVCYRIKRVNSKKEKIAVAPTKEKLLKAMGDKWVILNEVKRRKEIDKK